MEVDSITNEFRDLNLPWTKVGLIPFSDKRNVESVSFSPVLPFFAFFNYMTIKLNVILNIYEIVLV